MILKQTYTPHRLFFKRQHSIKAIVILSLVFLMSLITGCATRIPAVEKGHPTMSEAYVAAIENNDHVVSQSYLTTQGLVNDNSGLSQYTPNKGNSGNNKGKVVFHTPSLGGALQNPMVIEAQQKANKQFPMLPNPQVMLYIFPHYQDGLPLDGNWTAFSLYETNHYALPSEVLTGGNANV